MLKNVITLVSIFYGLIALGQNSTRVYGTVLDKEVNNEPLAFANVYIKGTSLGTTTDLEGTYSINVNPGDYVLVIEFLGYTPAEIPFTIQKGEAKKIDRTLAAEGVQLGDIVLETKVDKEKETALLAEQKKVVEMKQIIGAQELARKGISDAETAVAQVSGISKQEGVKNVFVRGLGDRYNFTTLNGLPIPSEDPLYKNISLDFFGSDLIKNINVSKAFSSDNYSDVGGAIIDISSKELMGNKEFNLDFSSGLNTKAIGIDFYQMDGVNYWGVSNNVQPLNNYRTEYAYGNSLDPHTISLPLNYSYGISGGKKLYLNQRKNQLTFFFVGNYSTKYSYTEENIYETTTNGTIVDDLKGYKSSQNINQMVLGNINFLINKNNEFNYNLVIIHDNNQFIGKYIGYGPKYTSSLQPEEYENDGFAMRQQSNDNLLITNQLLSKLRLSDKIELKTGLSLNTVTGTEPDRRINKLFRYSDTEYQFLAGDGANVRNFNELKENDINAKVDLTYKLAEKFENDMSSITVGYNGRFLTDNFEGNEYSMVVTTLSGLQTLDNLNFDNFLNQQNYDNDEFDGFARISNYTVDKYINSGYANFQYQRSKKLIGNIGLRADQIYLAVDYNVQGGYNGNGTQTLDTYYILPELNLKYNINDDNALRLGLSKTYTLPQSIELSPYQYFGPSYSVQGNPNLKPSDNYNADLKWDYYLSPSELLSLTAFYKYIDKPITRVYQNNGAGYYTFDNMRDASVAGVELELRKNIINKFSSDKANKLSAGINASYIYSNMYVNSSSSVSRYSQLEGSSPFLLNIDLSQNYSHNDFSILNTLVLKYFSDRIFSLGFVGYNDVIEQGIPTLDFVSTTNMNKHFSIKFKAKNILDPKYELTRKASNSDENQVLHSYYKGVNVSLGMSYQF